MQYPALIRIAAALSLLLLATQVQAQPAPQYSQTQVFSSFTKAARSTDISATTSSSRQTLTAAPVAIVYNTGTVAAFVELGGNTVSANATTSTFVPPGSCVFMNAVGATNIAGVTATGTATLEVVTGTGTFGSCGGGGGSGGGSSGAVFGPTAVGSPAANPPVVIGGTVDGTATGNVSVLKVLGGLGFINCANCSGSGVSAADTAAFIAGTSLLAPGGGFFQTTATSNALTNGQTGMWQMTAQRAGFVNLRNASGAELGVSAAPLQVSLANTAANGTALLVTGTGGTFPLPTGAATSANQALSLGSVAGGTAATNSMLGGGVYNSSTITLTNGQQAAFQFDVNGNLKTTGGGGGGGSVTQGTSPWVDNFSQFGGTNVSIGQQLAAASLPVVLNSDQDARTTPQNITAQDTLSTITAGNNSVNLITGSPTAGSTAAQAVNGQSSATVQVTGTWTGTLEVDISADSGTTWVVSNVNQRGTGGTVGNRLSSFTGDGFYQLDLAGVTNVRVRATAAMTGTAVVQFDFSAAVGLVRVQNPISVIDNTSGAAETIKLASTAPLATDTSVVVALNPGAPNPVTGSVAGAATDSGNPIKVGCKFNTTPPTYTDGQRSDCQSDTRGNARVSLYANNSTTSLGNAGQPSQTQALGAYMPVFGAMGGQVSSSGFEPQIGCSKSAVVNVTAGNTTEIVALTSAQTIYVCSFSVVMSLSGSAQFQYGTGSNCGTGNTNITGDTPLATGTPWSITAPSSLFRTASANAICVKATTGNVVGFISYAKF